MRGRGRIAGRIYRRCARGYGRGCRRVSCADSSRVGLPAIAWVRNGSWSINPDPVPTILGRNVVFGEGPLHVGIIGRRILLVVNCPGALLVGGDFEVGC